jgi:DNA-binding protein HU-beta
MKQNAKLTAAVQASLGCTKTEAETAIKSVLESTKSIAQSEGKLTIQEFGTFSMKEKAARVARNPMTGEKVNVPAKTVFQFKASK